MTENELKHAVLVMARAAGWAVQHTSQSKPRRPVRGTANGTAPGFPDLCLARDGEVIFMELKQQHESPTPEQFAWAAALGRGWHLIRPSDLASGRVAELLA